MKNLELSVVEISSIAIIISLLLVFILPQDLHLMILSAFALVYFIIIKFFVKSSKKELEEVANSLRHAGMMNSIACENGKDSHRHIGDGGCVEIDSDKISYEDLENLWNAHIRKRSKDKSLTKYIEIKSNSLPDVEINHAHNNHLYENVWIKKIARE